MGLAIRMFLYALFVTLANQGFVILDLEAGTVTFRIEDLKLLVGGAGGFAGTFAVGRWFKARGGLT